MIFNKKTNGTLLKLQEENLALQEELKKYKHGLNNFGWYTMRVVFTGTFEYISKIQKDLLNIAKDKFPTIEMRYAFNGNDESLLYISSYHNTELPYDSWFFYTSSTIGYTALFINEILKYSKENSCSFLCSIDDRDNSYKESHDFYIFNGELTRCCCFSSKYSSYEISDTCGTLIDSIISEIKEKDEYCYSLFPISNLGDIKYGELNSTVSYLISYSFMPFLVGYAIFKNPTISFEIEDSVNSKANITISNGVITYPKIQNMETA